MRTRSLITSIAALAALGTGVLALTGAGRSTTIERIDFDKRRDVAASISDGEPRRPEAGSAAAQPA